MAYTTQDLTRILQSIVEPSILPDETQYRYVIYARKSQESEERQVRSLGDQVDECMTFADHNKIKVVDVIKEAESAKEPDIRPKFRQMLTDFGRGKYDAILAWHPDRLARNMKDAGEMIDLLDKRVIKGLRFCSFTFENNTTGKMMLGISFVLSKQYSDQLSDNVKRGVRKSIEEGKCLNRPKHGYYKDRNKFMRPDGDNFTLLKTAWRIRSDGKTYNEIGDFLNKSGFSHPTDSSGKKHELYTMSSQRLSTLFKDTFYTGVFQYGNNIVDLTEVYDFVPMISVDNYLKLNRISNAAFRQKVKASAEGSVKSDFLRGLVLCGYCNTVRQTAITSKMLNGQKKLYFYFRCDNRDCSYYGKSDRAKGVHQFAIEFLQTHRFTSRASYDHYVSEMKRVIGEKEKILDSQRRLLHEERKRLEDKIEKTKSLILNEPDTEIKDIFKVELKECNTKLASVNDALEVNKIAIDKSRDAILTYQGFLELFDQLPEILRQTKGMREKDYIIRKIFLNFTIKDGNITSYQLNPPFDRFVKDTKILNGADERS